MSCLPWSFDHRPRIPFETQQLGVIVCREHLQLANSKRLLFMRSEEVDTPYSEVVGSAYVEEYDGRCRTWSGFRT